MEPLAHPRFTIEKKIWWKYKAHILESGLPIDDAIRILIVRYMKHNKLIDESVPERLPKKDMRLRENLKKTEKYIYK